MREPIAISRSLQARLSRGLDACQIVFLSAGAGWGKTAAARKLLEKRNADYVPLSRRSLPGGFPQRRLVVLDDLQALFSSRSERRLAELLRASPSTRRFVLLSRGPLPEFLLPYEAAGSLLQLGPDDLALDMDALARLARSYQAPLTTPDLRRLLQVTGGYPVAARSLLSALAAGRPFRRAAVEEMTAQVDAYLDRAVFRRLEPDARRVLLRGALFPSFTPGLMETLTGGGAGENALEALRRTTGLLRREGESWSLSGDAFVRPFLARKAAEVYTPEQIRDLHLSGARWYEGRGDRERALAHYRQADSRADMVRVLAEAARRRPEAGEEIGEYYDLLSEEEVESAPELMAAMSMLRSASFAVEEAEKWYGVLRAHAASMAPEDGDRPRVRGLVAYLDLALPHRGGAALERILPAVARSLAAGELILPELSVTGGLPSVLRGGKDLSRWVPRDRFWYDTLRAPAEAALGRFGVGLGEIALTESRLEKGEDVSGRLPALASLQKTLRTVGAPEMEVAVTALLARALYASGALEKAVALLEHFRGEMERAGHAHLLPDLDAMLCRLSLMGGDAYAATWFAERAPDERRFRAGARYRYLTKARCYVQREEFPSALLLLGRMLDDTKRFDRSLDHLESLLLTAICRFRMGGEGWRSDLRQALELGARFGYVSVFAREGAALLPLMERYDAAGVQPDYWRRVRDAVIVQAGYYGGYLRPLTAPAKRLTDTEDLVLRLVAQDRSNPEIAALLGIKVSTVKTHLRNLYQKLNVSSRAEAKRAAPPRSQLPITREALLDIGAIVRYS